MLSSKVRTIDLYQQTLIKYNVTIMPIDKNTKCINMLNFLQPKVLRQVTCFGYFFDV